MLNLHKAYVMGEIRNIPSDRVSSIRWSQKLLLFTYMLATKSNYRLKQSNRLQGLFTFRKFRMLNLASREQGVYLSMHNVEFNCIKFYMQ